MTQYYPGGQAATPAQISAMWTQIGAPGPIANAFATGIVPAEGGYNSGTVVNTAYPNLPNYLGSPQSVFGAGAGPEYSVGYYGLNLYPQYGPNGSTSAYQAGAALAADPIAQTQRAASLFNQRGFEPWTDPYVRNAGGSSGLLAQLGYSSIPQIPGANPNATGRDGPYTVTSTTSPTGTTQDNSSPPPAAASTGGSSSGVLGNCSGCLINLPSVAGIGGGCLFSKCNAKAIVGGAIAFGGALLMFGGVLVLVKSETGVAALARALQPARSAPAPSASTVTAPVESTAPAAPQVPEMAPDDTDEALADYYAGVAAGLDRANNPPRRPSRAGGQVVPTGGRVVDADEDDFDYDPPDLLAS